MSREYKSGVFKTHFPDFVESRHPRHTHSVRPPAHISRCWLSHLVKVRQAVGNYNPVSQLSSGWRQRAVATTTWRRRLSDVITMTTVAKSDCC